MKSKNESVPSVDAYGVKRWHSDNKLHREDGPAMEWYEGTKFWFLNDKRHREDGPAAEYTDGTNIWYLKDEFLGGNAEGFWTHWYLLAHTQRCNLNLHKWLVKYT